jgi:hypothetical protein
VSDDAGTTFRKTPRPVTLSGVHHSGESQITRRSSASALSGRVRTAYGGWIPSWRSMHPARHGPGALHRGIARNVDARQACIFMQPARLSLCRYRGAWRPAGRARSRRSGDHICLTMSSLMSAGVADLRPRIALPRSAHFFPGGQIFLLYAYSRALWPPPGAILQSSRPQISPATTILWLDAEHGTEHEATANSDRLVISRRRTFYGLGQHRRRSNLERSATRGVSSLLRLPISSRTMASRAQRLGTGAVAG